MKILITGVTGYIGSHTATELINNGYEVIGLDNLFNSTSKTLNAIKIITGKNIKFYNCDIRNIDSLDSIFSENTDIHSIIHFAGVKSVAESVSNPLFYYDNNVLGSINLIKIMKKYNIKNIVFSSSATVYAPKNMSRLSEQAETGPINPYGRTKLEIETILKDVHISDPDFNIICLRYFNPIGANNSYDLGENPLGIPNNLMPYICKVIIGKYPYLNIFGNDYQTSDGTAIRDYIHVVDLAIGHIKAIEHLEKKCGYEIFNLGIGKGYGVFEILDAIKSSTGISINYNIVSRRKGDIPYLVSDPTKANEILNFKPKYDIYKMCKDTINWQLKHPNGYEDDYFI